jgi:hypothetical protein
LNGIWKRSDEPGTNVGQEAPRTPGPSRQRESSRVWVRLLSPRRILGEHLRQLRRLSWLSGQSSRTARRAGPRLYDRRRRRSLRLLTRGSAVNRPRRAPSPGLFSYPAHDEPPGSSESASIPVFARRAPQVQQRGTARSAIASTLLPGGPGDDRRVDHEPRSPEHSGRSQSMHVGRLLRHLTPAHGLVFDASVSS